MGLGWWLPGQVAALTIVGIPWARACFVTIVAIPFGIQHFKLALIALAPIGMQWCPPRRLGSVLLARKEGHIHPVLLQIPRPLIHRDPPFRDEG